MPSEVASPSPDRIDRAIVSRLQVDGRLPNVDLAEAVSLSPSACLRRVKALEAGGVIAGYRAEVDRARAGPDRVHRAEGRRPLTRGVGPAGGGPDRHPGRGRLLPDLRVGRLLHRG